MILEAHRHGDVWFVEGCGPRQTGFGAGFAVSFVLTVLAFVFMAL